MFFLKKYKPRNIIIALFITFFILGGIRFEGKEMNQPKNIIDDKVGQSAVLTGIVVSEVEYRPSYQRFVMKVSEESSYKVLVSADRYPAIFYGDKVRVVGKIDKPSNFITDTGREFDYVQYLAKDEIYYRMSFARFEILGTKYGSRIRYSLFRFKESFLQAANRIIPDPESALLAGILLGVKQSLGSNLEQAFIDTGTIHIVVLSGYNVTVVSEAIVRTLQSFLPKNLALSFGGLGIVLFAIITGATTTTVRAAVMGILGLLARLTNRTYQITRALFLAAFVMVLINPYALVFDILFQLSFIATLGLIFISPIIEKTRIAQLFPKRFGLREIFSSTIATQIAVLPYLLYRIGTLSIVSPLANMLVLPVIPLAMGVGFLSGLIEMMFGFGVNPMTWVFFGLLRYVITLVEVLSSFSWSALSVGYFNSFFVLIFYLGIILFLVRWYRNPLVPMVRVKK